jgi:hypothetical protein
MRHDKPDKWMEKINDSNDLLKTDSKIVPAFHVHQLMGQNRFEVRAIDWECQVLRQDDHGPENPNGKWGDIGGNYLYLYLPLDMQSPAPDPDDIQDSGIQNGPAFTREIPEPPAPSDENHQLEADNSQPYSKNDEKKPFPHICGSNRLQPTANCWNLLGRILIVM